MLCLKLAPTGPYWEVHHKEENLRDQRAFTGTREKRVFAMWSLLQPGQAPQRTERGMFIKYIDLVNENHGRETMKAAVYAKIWSRFNGEDA